MASLKDWDIIKLSTLITNVDAKLSASTRTDRGYQILCLVRRNDQILFRYIDGKGEVHLMLLCWFAENQKCIQDVCFDNSESWLLVFCYDNTLHIVPALSICDKSATVEPTFTRDEITSFIVPFIGPHECPNPQTCPNNSHNVSSAPQSHRSSIASETSVRSSLSGSELGATSGLKRSESMHTTHKIDEIFSLNSIYNQLHGTEGQQSTAQDPITPIAMKTIENFFAEGKDDRMGASGMDTKASTPQECFSHTISSSIESTVSVSCPYPTCCSWWETLTNEPRAILGYSDGSICVVALTPNCPFLGNTNCERGSIEKLIICQDNSMETISLMINTSTKEQWKLLLEQKSIKYTFPGDISPSSSQELKEEMLKSLGDGEKPNSGLMDDWQIVLSLPKDGSGSGGDQGTDSGGEKGSSPSGSEPQSSDDFEKVEGECSTEDGKTDARDQQGALPKLFPAARARLMSLRDLGAKKIGTLKLKLSESRIKAKEKERIKEQAANLAVMELPGMYPEILTTPAGPYFVVQYLNGKYLLSALHSYSDTLSVHSMDISLIPLHIYKVPKQCKSTVLTRNVIYVTHHLSLGSERTTESTNSSPDANPETVGYLSEQPRRNTDSSIENLGSSQSQTQDEDASTETTNSGTVNAVSVVSCQIAAVKMGDDCDFNEHAMLALFQFPDEKILEIHRIGPLGDGSEAKDPDDVRFNAPDEPGDVRSVFQKSSVSNYLKMQRILRMDKKLETHESQVMVGEFPKVEFDRAAIVTDKNLYSLELNDTARNLFLKLAHKSLWAACEDFCTTFGLPLATCVEYAGDVLLKRKRITEALMTYNVARLSPMKTALKLASVNENGALMKLCSMALRNSHIINSQFVMHDVMRILVDEAHLGNVVYDSLMNLNAKVSLKPINAGAQCSDFSYENDDVSWDVQISTTAQFHLSNLMLLTLCERCVQDKNYIPLWNFIVTNSKYHTSLACIVLAHGKLYSSVILLAMVRGTCLDVFSWLIGIWEQLVDHPAEMNAYVYNLSNELFMESLIYLQEYTIQYFEMIRKCLEKFDINVLERLIRQLNPFHPIYRPLMHKLSNHDSSSGRELDNGLLLFCKCLIETFLAVSIRLQMLKMHNGSFLNALKHVRVFYDEKPVEMRLKQYSPLSAGFSHAGCVMNRVAYLWGSNGVNCALSRTSLQGDPLTPNGSPPTAFFLKQLDLEVLAVQCGRLHTLLLTNNGVYSMGANNLGQLGIGNHVLNALQPMYVQSLDGMNITHICAGQYHNAVVANGLLYTWGWGIFGQLGHGSVADCVKPTIVEFFRKKNIQQIALGHAHTLVLCRQECNTRNVLYVFGSNHYGQLGLGQEDKFNFTVDTRNGKSFVLSLIPRRVDFDEEILLINTKLFVNLVLTKSNKLYTWGASPQALRLANQARKRARSSHKCRPNVMTPAATAGPSTSPPSAEPEAKTDGPEPESKSPTVSNAPEEPKEEQQPKIEPEVEQPPAEGVDETPKTPNGGPVPDIKIEDTSAGDESKTPEVDEKAATPGEEFAEHLFPSLVDTTLVQDDIVRISSGLYHFALVTSRSQIYTWGKNIERQLGREGGRNEILIPTKLDTVTGVEYVECGADFTLIMTEDGVVKSWGNNNMGQCAKEINQERSGVPGKLVRLPISNRLVRIPDSSQFIELPHEIKLPPSDGSHEPSNQMLRLIKSMPKFRRNFVVKSTLEKVISNNISTISSSLNDVSNTTEMDDFVGELRTAFDCRIQNQNASTMSSLQSVSYATSPTSLAVDDDEDDEGLEDMDQDDRSSESSRLCNERHLLSNDFIHYCLYIFHGLYSQDNILELTKRCNEYHIRMMMLNYDYVEAFHLILELLSGSLSSSASPVTVAKTTMNLVKIFEYFTKDSNIIPMDTSNFKYFIYELFMFFIKHNINLDVLEEYFLRNLEYYLVQLAFVLYFSNTNNISAGLRGNVDSETLEMERRLLDKFNNNGNNLMAAEAFGPSSPQSTGKVVRKLENTETISKALSTKFSVMLCQKLMEYFERFK